MENKKDKMYDFGELGKWSESTLKEQITPLYSSYDAGFIRYEIIAIENVYESVNKKINDIYPRKYKNFGLKGKQIINFKKWDQVQFEGFLCKFMDMQVKSLELSKNYEEYKSVMFDFKSRENK